MREVTATEASRSFSALLDQVEAGRGAVITRGGRRVARVTPVDEPNGDALVDFLRRRAGASSGIDDAFAQRVSDVRGSARADLDSDPWQG